MNTFRHGLLKERAEKIRPDLDRAREVIEKAENERRELTDAGEGGHRAGAQGGQGHRRRAPRAARGGRDQGGHQRRVRRCAGPAERHPGRWISVPPQGPAVELQGDGSRRGQPGVFVVTRSIDDVGSSAPIGLAAAVPTSYSSRRSRARTAVREARRGRAALVILSRSSSSQASTCVRQTLETPAQTHPAPLGDQATLVSVWAAVMASPRPTSYVLRSQGIWPCRGSGPGEERVSGGIAVSPRQQCSHPQQPNVAYHQTLRWRNRGPPGCRRVRLRRATAVREIHRYRRCVARHCSCTWPRRSR